MPSFTIDINFEINTDALQEAEESLQNLRDSAEDVQDSTESISGDSIADMGASAEDTSDSIKSATDSMQEFSNKTEEANQKMQETAESSMGLGEAIVGIGGAIGFDAMLSSGGNLEDSFNRLTLTFEGTGVSIDSLKQKSSELSAETGRSRSLIRDYMNQMGIAGVTNTELLGKSFEALSGKAYQTNSSVEQMSMKMQMMVMSGNSSNRMLQKLGLTTSDLADAMGVTEEQVSDTFKTLSQEERLEAVTKAMGDGTEANDMYKNSYEGLKEQAGASLSALASSIGQSILPIVIPAMQGAKRIIDGVTTAFKNLPAPIQSVIGMIGAGVLGFITLSSTFSALTKLMGTGALAPLKTFFTTLLGGEGIIASITAGYNAMAISEYIALAPLLAIIGAIILLGVAVYEVGKYFGWWTDVGTMMDSISAGVQRLWSAFINNPDVQAFIQGIKDAWASVQPALASVIDSVLGFFGISNSGEFDIVRALIDAIGFAWNSMRDRILLVINVVQSIISVFQSVVSAVSGFITNVVGQFTALPTKISNAVSGITGILTKPFTDAWNTISGTVNNITGALNNLNPSNWFGAEYEGFNNIGYEGFDNLNTSISNSSSNNSQSVTNNFNIHGIIEETASEYIVDSVNSYMKKQNLVRGV